MTLDTVENRKAEILRCLQDKNVSEIILYGDDGMGKSCMARKIHCHAINREESCYAALWESCFAALWLSLNRRYNKKSLYENIAQQLSLLSTAEEWNGDGDEVESGIPENLKKKSDMEDNTDDLKRKISEELSKRRSEKKMADEEKFSLLFLDNEGEKTNREFILSELGLQEVLSENGRSDLKILITMRGNCGGFSNVEKTHRIEFGPLLEKDLQELLQELLEKKECIDRFQSLNELSKAIVQRSHGSPASIVVLAGVLKEFAEHKSGVCKLGAALKEAIGIEEGPGSGAAAHSVEATGFDKETDGKVLVCSGHDTLPNAVMVNCFWHSWQCFRTHGAVHFNELIAHWIMEGYFDPRDSMEQAYHKGHSVLMQLMDHGLLKIQEDNIVAVEGAAVNMIDCHCRDFYGRSHLGLANVPVFDSWGGLGRITWSDGMIKTLTSSRKGEKVSTLLIDGSRLCSEVPETFFLHMPNLKVLVIFNPRLNSLPASLSKLDDKLLVLVLRGCELLEKITDVDKLRLLRVLEISGASLSEIPQTIFKEMTHIQSLNLSALKIKSLPDSVSNLTELRWLVLRSCYCLERLPKLRASVKLEVLDLRHSTSFKRFTDKSFSVFHKLQMLDLSYTQIDRLPIFRDKQNPQTLDEFRRLILRGCERLNTLPSLESLSALQVLDISGAAKLQEINDDHLKNKEALRILDFSETETSHLPPNFRDLSELHLRGCHGLIDLPQLEGVKQLQVLDLSGCKALEEIQDKSIERMPRLRVLKLSETNIKSLPSLCRPNNLQELDLSGVSCVSEITSQFLEHMTNLHSLKLSKITFKNFSFLSNLTNLTELSLRDCSGSKTMLPLEALKKLEVLDLSGEAVGSLPSSLENIANLRKLSLHGFESSDGLPSLKSLPHLEIVDALGNDIKELIPIKCDHCDTKYYRFFREYPNPQEPAFLIKQLVFSVCSSKEEVKDGGKCHHSDKLIFSNVYFKTRHFPAHEGDGESIEIRGFDHLPADVMDALRKYEYFSLIKNENTSFSCLSDLIAGKLDKLKGCWIESCIGMESIFKGDKDTELRKNLEILWISNLHNLKTICHGGQPSCFNNLKQLHIYSCPILETVFSSSLLPENLQFLQITFCDKLKVLFKDNESAKITLPKLETLHICSCPMLETVFSSSLSAENLQILRITFCDELKVLFKDNESATITLPKLETLHIRSCPILETVFPSSLSAENLQILRITFCDKLKVLFKDNESAKITLPKLETLHICSCPILETVFPSSLSAENLQILRITFCDKLKVLFKDNESAKITLPKLETLHLLELPQLMSIQAILPPLKNFKISGVPESEYFRSLRTGNAVV
ncbi:hypothetical protein SLE2022_224120 [Rubroshorea leprosula]